ncbi:MAG: hypothetical protein GEU94_06840 [Micromonosporaceae bacterium]|nr:hypothetical protein [Micromonosporaceae bacterium]
MRSGTLHVLFGFFAALFVASQLNIIAELGPIGADLIRLQSTLSAETFRNTLDGFTAGELARYRGHFAWDSVHPLIYGGLLLLWTYVVHRRRPFSTRVMRTLVGLAIAAPALDYVENGFHLFLETHREAINAATVAVSGTATILKSLLLAVLVVALLLATVRALLTRPRPALNHLAPMPYRPAAAPTPADEPVEDDDLDNDRDR